MKHISNLLPSSLPARRSVESTLPATRSEGQPSADYTDPCAIAACLDKLGRVFGFPASWDETTAGIWIDALSNIPLDLLRLAVDRYICLPETGRRYFPQPGQLRAMIADDLVLTCQISPQNQELEWSGERVTAEEVERMIARYRASLPPAPAEKPRPKPAFVVNAQVWRE